MRAGRGIAKCVVRGHLSPNSSIQRRRDSSPSPYLLHGTALGYRFKGLTEFIDNTAVAGGAVYNRESEPYNFEDYENREYKVPILIFSDQTFFENNTARAVSSA